MSRLKRRVLLSSSLFGVAPGDTTITRCSRAAGCLCLVMMPGLFAQSCEVVQ
jgi:hypothetical protein